MSDEEMADRGISLGEAQPGQEQRTDDAQIKHMVDRFLMWRLPEDFHPDNGISFKPTFNDWMDPPMRHDPVGTNLLNADQAEAMVRFMVDGLATRPTADLGGLPAPNIFDLLEPLAGALIANGGPDIRYSFARGTGGVEIESIVAQIRDRLVLSREALTVARRYMPDRQAERPEELEADRRLVDAFLAATY